MRKFVAKIEQETLLCAEPVIGVQVQHPSEFFAKEKKIYLSFIHKRVSYGGHPNQDSRHDIGKILSNNRQARNCLEFCCSIRIWNIQILVLNDQIIYLKKIGV